MIKTQALKQLEDGLCLVYGCGMPASVNFILERYINEIKRTAAPSSDH